MAMAGVCQALWMAAASGHQYEIPLRWTQVVPMYRTPSLFFLRTLICGTLNLAVLEVNALLLWLPFLDKFPWGGLLFGGLIPQRQRKLLE